MKKLISISGTILLIFVVLHGCLEEKDPAAISTHPTDWNAKQSANFHGDAVLTKSLSLESCQSCHGEDYLGGTSEISCYSSGCHAVYPHPENFGDVASETPHNKFIAEMANWDILSCQSCHGADYAGNGFQEKNCLTCHNKADGPEDCSTCHGGDVNSAPPVDLAKNTNASVREVGAHQEHLLGSTWSTFDGHSCNSCHLVPQNYSDAGHIDDSPGAEIIFNSLATNGGELHALWSRSDATCASVYCHGSFEFRKEDSAYEWAYTDSVISGNDPSLFWISVGTGQAFCGSCHGLPPAGHIPAQTCHSCHSSVVDENLNIINKYLHINGKIDVY